METIIEKISIKTAVSGTIQKILNDAAIIYQTVLKQL